MSEAKKGEAKSKPNLDGYVEVHDRIEAFYEKYPEGSLQSKWDMLEIGGAPVIVVEAKAYRTAQDTRPGIGLASEPVPGRTPYTKDSELMNAETSAWGRALAALGFKVKSGIATGNEVRARQGGEKRHAPSPKQLDFFKSLAEKCGFSESTDPKLGQVLAYASRNLTGGKGGSMSQLIDQLKGPDSTERADELGRTVKEWAAKQESDMPAPDTEGLPSEEPAEKLPF